jgi:hypothetical protein
LMRNKAPANFAGLQRGVVLLLVVLVMLAIGGTVLFAGIGANVAQTERRLAKSNAGADTLQNAKQVLIGYVLSPPNADYRPGVLPTPDSLANGLYDGLEDASCLSTGTNGLPGAGGVSLVKRCLGKLPWKSIGFDAGNVDNNDPAGSLPWLAISANLAFYDGCLKVLNSDSAKLPSPGTVTCPSPALPYPQPGALPQPWLTVVNEAGTVLSNRVAAVLIVPGPPIATETRAQARTAANPGSPVDYLDDIRVPLGCTSGCTTYDNAGLTNAFVSIAPGTKYPMDAQDSTVRGRAIPYNDQLLYVTIDELLPFIERRVAGQMAASLRAFKSTGNYTPALYPWMSPLTTAPILTTSLTNAQGTYFGAFPFMTDYLSTNNADYSTDFDWAFSGFTETAATSCTRIGTSPSNRYVKNTLINAILAPLATPNLASGTAPATNAVCQWKGLARVQCGLSTSPTPTVFLKNMTLYSNSTCTTTAGSATLSVSRAVTSLNIDATCTGTLVHTYTAASATDVHRRRWACSNIASTSTIVLAATDTVSNNGTTYNQLPRSFSTTLVIPASGTKSVTVDRIRDLPIMPGWFHENLWYQSAFAAVAPASAPNNTLPCGAGVNTFTVGNMTGVEAAVLQAGAYIAGVNTGTRPASSIATYAEGLNQTGKGGAIAGGINNCNFVAASSPVSTTANDQLIVVSP